ncbi:FAD-binding oxidoreductase [Phenylobacterium sp. VNQ135]|uniref:FAD-binding oxidoreductase n=1 Tax=Phenylobacterium sp. VNQ135 TaxID=3400922 RepID=UPI003C0600ED
MNLERLTADLQGLLEPEDVLTAQEDLASYDAPARYEAGRAAAVVRPRTVDGVSKVMGYCVSRGVRLVPQGANTGLVAGSTADGSGTQVVLSLERLRTPLRVDPANRTARVGAGVRLSALNQALEPHGLFLPIDLGADPTLGGMAATNTGGARFIRYGDMRRHVLGLQVVLPDRQGSVVELKGGLRKDNTGLDLRQLFVGSCGALGVITEVEVEVHPRPRQTAAALIALANPDAALPLLQFMEREAGELLTAFEGMSRAAFAAALAHAPALRNPFPGGPPPYAVLVELSTARSPQGGDAPLGQVLEAILAAWLETAEADAIDVLVGAPEPLWAIRHAISEGLRAKGQVIGFDLAFRRSDLPAFRDAALDRLGRQFPAVEICDFGHIGDGGVHFNLVAPRPGLPDAGLKALRTCVYELAVGQFGGSFSGEHGLGRANLESYRAYTPDLVRELAGGVQNVFSEAPIGAVDFVGLFREQA